MSNEYNENMNLKLLGYGLEIKKDEERAREKDETAEDKLES